MNPKYFAALKLLSTMFLVAVVLTFAKKALSQVHFFTFIWLQMVFACSGILVYYLFLTPTTHAAAKGQNKLQALLTLIRQKRHRKALMLILVVGFLNYLMIRWLAIFALQYLPVTTHAYLTNYVALVTMFFSAIFVKEFPNAKQWLGALIAILGLWSYFKSAPKAEELIGIVAVALTVIGLATTNILLRKLHLLSNNPFNHAQIAVIAICTGGIPLILIGLMIDIPVTSISVENWVIIALNGLIANALIMLVFSQAMQHLKAYEASLLAMSAVVFIALLAVPILEQVLVFSQMIGIALMITGIALVQRYSSS
ncbi:MAG: DMT family transporter [Enterobacterales bacterium]|nr:DMT family transporter [Enterobacterales bacterium]